MTFAAVKEGGGGALLRLSLRYYEEMCYHRYKLTSQGHLPTATPPLQVLYAERSSKVSRHFVSSKIDDRICR